MDTAVVSAVWYDIHRAVGVIAVIVDSPRLLYDDWIHFRQEDTIDLKVEYQYIRYYFLKPTRCGGKVNQNTAEIEHAPSSTQHISYRQNLLFAISLIANSLSLIPLLIRYVFAPVLQLQYSPGFCKSLIERVYNWKFKNQNWPILFFLNLTIARSQSFP